MNGIIINDEVTAKTLQCILCEKVNGQWERSKWNKGKITVLCFNVPLDFISHEDIIKSLSEKHRESETSAWAYKPYGSNGSYYLEKLSN